MRRILFGAIFLMVVGAPCWAQKRLVLIDQDGSGPGGSNQMAMMVLLQSPRVEVLGITIVTGNAWRDEEVQHTLRMLELIGRSDVPVVPGAVFPLVRTEEETRIASQLFGKVVWLGAWGLGPMTLAQNKQGVIGTTANPNAHGPWEVPPMPEGAPHTKPLDEDAAHFLIRQVHAHPHQVTIYAAGPLTNIALALAIDPHFAELTQGIVIMGGSLNPQTEDPEFSTSPRHEFNFWFDPEGGAHHASRALAAHRRDHRRCVDQGPVYAGDVRHDLEIAESRGAIHREILAGALLLVGRTHRPGMDRSKHHHERTAVVHGRRCELTAPVTGTR